MKLTKYTHACVRLEKEGHVLVIDPGTFSESKEALAGAHAVLVTHEHNDHIDRPAVVAALRENTTLEVHAPAGVAAALREDVVPMRVSLPVSTPQSPVRSLMPAASTCAPSGASMP